MLLCDYLIINTLAQNVAMNVAMRVAMNMPLQASGNAFFGVLLL